MRALLLGFAACTLVACGGKVVLDGAGASSGGSSMGGQGGGAADGGACPGLLAALDAAIGAARACNPDAPTSPCTTTVTDLCGCAFLASTQGNGVAEAEEAFQAAGAAGCSQPCPGGCPAANTMFSVCLPTSSGGECAEGPPPPP